MTNSSGARMAGGARAPRQAIDFATASIAEVLAALDTNPKRGLAPVEAESRLAKFGPNALEEKKTSQWAVLFGYFWGPIPLDD